MSAEIESQTSSERPNAPRRFDGKTALVTGASDRGIGGSIARRLASEGAGVSILSKQEPAQLLRRIGRAGGEVIFTGGDVCHENDVRRAIDASMDRFGQIDIVVNNAGLESFGRLEEVTDEKWQSLLDVNLTGAMKVTRATLPYLTRPGGVFVNVASALGLGGCDGFTAYSATKAGLMGFTQSLAMELAPQGLRAVCVAPALVLTPMSRTYLNESIEEAWERVQRSHPLGVGLPEDVAAAVAFLASSEARWITGITLPLGWSSSFALPTDLFMKRE
jgi:NAD(P)-dependent dehydrogenase (short-subunit alcohol dehydrogenase family)